MPTEPSLTFLVACHNRRALTIASLASAFGSADRAGISASAVIFDDGSADGTGRELREEHGSRVTVLEGDGTSYWARSMARAEEAALEATPTHLMWLNDDVILDEDALGRLLELAEAFPGQVLVASTRDPSTGVTTYGGLRRSGPHPLAFALVEPPKVRAIPVAAMNGNLVLVPTTVAREMGGIDGGYAHALADVDYAHRLARRGRAPMLASGTYGACSRNPTAANRSRFAAWKSFTSIKGGGHPASAARYLRRAAPVMWPIWWSGTYLKWWARAILDRNFAG